MGKRGRGRGRPPKGIFLSLAEHYGITPRQSEHEWKKDKDGNWIDLKKEDEFEANNRVKKEWAKKLGKEEKKVEWHTGEEPSDLKATSCSYVKDETDEKIFLSPEIYCKIKSLCTKIEDEWQMFLSGEAVEGGIFLKDYYIPKQEVTGSSVKNLDCIDKKFIEDYKILASIHSHSSMGVFFSSTDENDTNLQSLDYHIVTNNNGEFKACKKVRLPCGLLITQDIKINLRSPDDSIIGVDNIKKYSNVNYSTGYSRAECYGGYGV